MITSLVFELGKTDSRQIKGAQPHQWGAESADEECTKWKGLIPKSCSVMQQLVNLSFRHVHHM